jgi:hypothetical protein
MLSFYLDNVYAKQFPPLAPEQHIIAATRNFIESLNEGTAL